MSIAFEVAEIERLRLTGMDGGLGRGDADSTAEDAYETEGSAAKDCCRRRAPGIGGSGLNLGRCIGWVVAGIVGCSHQHLNSH